MNRVLLVRHAMTSEIRRSIFPTVNGGCSAEPGVALEEAGHRVAGELGTWLPTVDRCWSSFAKRTVQTAAAFSLSQCSGLPGVPIESTPELAGWDVGTWAGRSLAELHAVDPAALRAWLADPDLIPHGGGGLPELRRTVRGVLERAARLGGTTVVVTDGDVVAAALLEALRLPGTALWRCDVAPASVTELHPMGGGDWRVARVNWRPAPFRSEARS